MTSLKGHDKEVHGHDQEESHCKDHVNAELLDCNPCHEAFIETVEQEMLFQVHRALRQSTQEFFLKQHQDAVATRRGVRQMTCHRLR